LKIGLFGGTFDPIHLGHLRAAENAKEALGLGRVLFVPVGTPPHRPDLGTRTWDRFAMVSLATSGNPAFVPSDLEIKRDGFSYTVDTLTAAQALYPGDELVLIVGTDAFGEIATWREHARIFEMARIAVVHRPGEMPSSERALELPSDRVSWVEAPGLPISATDIRRRVSQGKSIRYLVTDPVADYIEKRALYR
jgi:nicotinate-nucleotide adenylyltransferase